MTDRSRGPLGGYNRGWATYMRWKSGIEYAVKHAPQLALSLTSSPYTPTARGGSVALVHAIRSPRPLRTTTILSIARTIALSPFVGSLGVGVRPPIPSCPVQVTSATERVPSNAPLPLTGVTGAPPTLAPRRRIVRPLPTPSAGASGSRLSSSHPAKLVTSSIRVFGSSWSLVAVLASGAPPAAVLPVVAWSACRIISNVGAGLGTSSLSPSPSSGRTVAGERFGLLGRLCFTIPLEDMMGISTSSVLTVSFVSPELALLERRRSSARQVQPSPRARLRQGPLYHYGLRYPSTHS